MSNLDVNTELENQGNVLDLGDRRRSAGKPDPSVVLSETILAKLAEFTDSSNDIHTRIELGIQLQSEMLPLLLRETLSTRPSVDRSIVAARFGIAIRDSMKMLQESLAIQVKNEERKVAEEERQRAAEERAKAEEEKRKLEEAKNEIDLNHPKIQTAFGWVIDVFQDVLTVENIDLLTKKSIFMTLQSKLTGWEERSNKALKGLSLKALKDVSNPIQSALEDLDFEATQRPTVKRTESILGDDEESLD